MTLQYIHVLSIHIEVACLQTGQAPGSCMFLGYDLLRARGLDSHLGGVSWLSSSSSPSPSETKTICPLSSVSSCAAPAHTTHEGLPPLCLHGSAPSLSTHRPHLPGCLRDRVKNGYLCFSSLPTSSCVLSLKALLCTPRSTGAFYLVELIPASVFVLMAPRPLWVPNEEATVFRVS